MSLSRLPLPSFSIILTRPGEAGVPVEILNLADFRRASRRSLHLNIQPKDDDPLMKTVDTRFSGSFAYDVDYADQKKAAHHRNRNTASSLSGSSGASSTAVESEEEEVEEDAVSIASSTSTNEVDLNSEFAKDNDIVTLSDYDVGEVGQTNPPPRLWSSSLDGLPPCYECDPEGEITTQSLGESDVSSRDCWTQRTPAPHKNRHWSNFGRMLRLFWRRLKHIGTHIVYECTKDL